MKILSSLGSTTAIGLVLAAYPAMAASLPVITEATPTTGSPNFTPITTSSPINIVASPSAAILYYTDFGNDLIGFVSETGSFHPDEPGSPLEAASNHVVGIAIGTVTIAPDELPSLWATVQGGTPARRRQA
jgi:hypothetical protein